MESCISKERIQLHILGPLSVDSFDSDPLFDDFLKYLKS